ncbi:MAG: hypothetical protein ACR2IF_00225 [Terriglobales bacterium]
MRRDPYAMPHNVLQEYLEALAEGIQHGPTVHKQKALVSYAELQYRLKGGGRCAVCNAAVRHKIPVTSEHIDGTIAEFGCLCTRCLEAEKALSRKVELQVGEAHVEYLRASEEDPHTKKFRAYGS